MHPTTLLHHHRHDRILVRLPALLVNADDLVDFDVAHKVSHDENKVGRDDSVGVDVAHRIAWCECLFGGDDGYDLDS